MAWTTTPAGATTIREVSILSTDVANHAASAISRFSNNSQGITNPANMYSIDTSYYVGAVQVNPNPGEQWSIQKINGSWRLHSRIPFNDPNQQIMPVQGQHIVGSGSGSVELQADQINANAPLGLQGYPTSGLPDPPPAGSLAWNTTTSQVNVFTGSAWDAVGGGSAGVTTVSVVSANGLAGTVATPTTTPAITLSTTITGMLKGNGTAISAGVAGTDYTTPSSTETFTNKTISGSNNTLSNIAVGSIAATGTANSSTFLRGDGTWSAPPGGLVGSTTPVAGDASVWDSNLNLTSTNFLSLTTSTATAAGTTTLTITSSQVQIFTGTTTQTVKLPTTSVSAGQSYTIINQSTGAVTVQSSGANTIATLSGSTVGVFICQKATPTAATDWVYSIEVDGKGLTAKNQLALAGTDGTTMTFPGTSDTVVTLGATQTLTAKTLTSPTLTTPVLGTPSSGTLTNCTGLPLAGLLAAAYNTTPTASTLAEWDSNKNLSANVFLSSTTSTATAAGTTTLTITSTQVQVFTGTTTQTVLLPTTSITAGLEYVIVNQSTGAVTVQSSGANTVATLAGSTTGIFVANKATPSAAADWSADVIAFGKALLIDNSLELAGTDGTKMTFPGTSDTVVTLGATQTLTSKTLTSPTLTTPVLGTPSSGTLTNCTGLPVGGISATGTASSTTFLRGDGSWQTVSSGSGTVTSVSVVSANGFAGSVATSTTTPAITISTSITGVLKGNGTAISAATAGTDYTSPAGTETISNKTYTGYTETVQALGTVTTAKTISSTATNGTVCTATLTAADTCTFTLPTPAAGVSFILVITQAATPTGLTAWSTPSGTIKWAGGVAHVMTATASKVDIISWFSDGTNWYGNYSQSY